MRQLLLAIAITLSMGSCSDNSAASLTQCGHGSVGRTGGTVTSPTGASISVPAGVLVSDVDLSVCVLEVGRVPRQRSPVIEFGPVDLPLMGAVTMTVPIDDTSSSPSVAEVRRHVSDTLVSTFPIVLSPPGFATFDATILGDARLMDAITPDDASVDGATGADDVNRPDAPRPVGPVVVGPDLTPANYACLGMIPTPTTGPAMPVTMHVTDWSDHNARASYVMSADPSAGVWDSSGTCAASADCATGTTGASGDVSLMLAPGPQVVTVQAPTTMASDTAHMPVLQWIFGLSIANGATTIDVPVLSQRSATSISSSIGFGGQFILGHVRDCDDAPVQRVRVRLFDASGAEITASFFGGPPIIYGNGLDFPAGSGDRSAVDGVYLSPLNGSSMTMRIEAWGHLALDGRDVLLSCETLSFPGFAATLVDLRPLHADVPSACGSVP